MAAHFYGIKSPRLSLESLDTRIISYRGLTGVNIENLLTQTVPFVILFMQAYACSIPNQYACTFVLMPKTDYQPFGWFFVIHIFEDLTQNKKEAYLKRAVPLLRFKTRCYF